MGKLYDTEVMGTLTVTYGGKTVNVKEMLDMLGVCYIVESGTYGIWNYKKFSDGTAHLFASIELADLELTTQMESLYRTEILFDPTLYLYPFEFTKLPVSQVSFKTTNGIGGLPWAATTGGTMHCPSYYIVRQNSKTGGAGVFEITVDGYWK